MQINAINIWFVNKCTVLSCVATLTKSFKERQLLSHNKYWPVITHVSTANSEKFMILQILTLPHSEKVYKNKALLNS